MICGKIWHRPCPGRWLHSHADAKPEAPSLKDGYVGRKNDCLARPRIFSRVAVLFAVQQLENLQPPSAREILEANAD